MQKFVYWNVTLKKFNNSLLHFSKYLSSPLLISNDQSNMIHDDCRQDWDTTIGAGKKHNQRCRQEWDTTTVAGKHHRGSLNLVSIYVDPWQEQL